MTKFNKLFNLVDPKEFASSLKHAEKANPKITEYVTQYTPEELAQMKTYLHNDGKAGYGLKQDGDLVNVFSGVKGRGDDIVTDAKVEGAKKLDAYDGYLPKLYNKHGFEELRREPNWTPKGPDVVYMGLPEHQSEIISSWTPEQLKLINQGVLEKLSKGDPAKIQKELKELIAARLGNPKIKGAIGAGLIGGMAMTPEQADAALASPISEGVGQVAGNTMEAVDDVTGAPVRKGAKALLDGKSYSDIPGKVEGRDVAKSFLSKFPQLGFPTKDPLTNEVTRDYPLEAPVGFAADVALDPTNLAPGGALAAGISNFPMLKKFIGAGSKVEPVARPIEEFAEQIYKNTYKKTPSGLKSQKDWKTLNEAIDSSSGVGSTLMDKLKTEDPAVAEQFLKSQGLAEYHSSPLIDKGLKKAGAAGMAIPPNVSYDLLNREIGYQIPAGKGPRDRSPSGHILMPTDLTGTPKVGVLEHENQHIRENDYQSLPANYFNELLSKGGHINRVPNSQLREALNIYEKMKIRDVPDAQLFGTFEAKRDAIRRYIDHYNNGLQKNDIRRTMQGNNFGHFRDYKDMELDYPAKALLEDALKNGEPIDQSWLQNFEGFVNRLRKQSSGSDEFQKAAKDIDPSKKK